MRLALVFSGQGNQRPEHWQQLASNLDAPLEPSGAALRQALPGLDDGSAMATLDTESLQTNGVAQPLIFALQMRWWAQLRPHLPRPICAAGYSLGEVAACCAAGAFLPEAGLAATVVRARLMDAAVTGEYGMLAVLGLDDTLVTEIAGEAGLAVAIRNGPRHLVVAGPSTGIDQASSHFEAAGAARLIRLAVKTPSHTALLAKAAADFDRYLKSSFESTSENESEHERDRRLGFPVLSAIDGTASRLRGAAGDALARQICTPLDWDACQQAIVEMQPDRVLEIGAGNALARLFAEHAPEIPVRACDDFRSVDGVIRWFTDGGH